MCGFIACEPIFLKEPDMFRRCRGMFGYSCNRVFISDEWIEKEKLFHDTYKFTDGTCPDCFKTYQRDSQIGNK